LQYRKTANIIQQSSVYHTVNGGPTLFHNIKNSKKW